jgi:competence protein ComEC
MRIRYVIGVILIVILCVRVYTANSPWKFANGDIVKLSIHASGWGRNEEKRWGLVHRNLWIGVPPGMAIEIGQRIKIVGRVDTKVTDGRVWQKMTEYSSFIILDKKKGLFEDLKSKPVRWLPGEAGALSAGILFGESSFMTPQGKADFRSSGLSHVVAASGYNVTVVSGAVMIVLKRLIGRKLAIPFGIVCISLYVLIAGASAAVVRAGIMAGLALLGILLGRKADAWILFAATIWLMLFIRPEWVLDIGFQLSVAATAGLLLGGMPEGVWWKADLKTTTLAQIMTLPLILHYFGSISIWAPVVNMLVLWTVPWIMEIGGVAMILGLVFDQLGMLVSFLAWPLLIYMVFVVKAAASWPGNGLLVGQISWWWVAVYYMAVGSGFWIKSIRRGK